MKLVFTGVDTRKFKQHSESCDSPCKFCRHVYIKSNFYPCVVCFTEKENLVVIMNGRKKTIYIYCSYKFRLFSDLY